MQIQWYPGHMAKARRQLAENLKLIDVVVELVDARAPASTRNPDFDDLFSNKQRVVVLNKADLADPELTRAWIKHYEGQGISAIPYTSTSGNKAAAKALIEQAAATKVAQMKARGVIKTVRVMVVGIPNVGKSTFINRIAGAARAKVGDRPGVTRANQWVKITPYLELMDTPGLLWPKLENEAYAKRLFYIGSIKDDIMDVEGLAAQLLVLLMELCPNALTARYAAVASGMAGHELLTAVCGSRGFILAGGEPDTERAARIVLDEFRAGKIARITLDKPEEQL
ncbi:MAG: ribosome biogenesis GTPase YlqF [Eubacteriales bacterium]|nr:ribosome biogenesis GTPase YlqF [Eubacteriales bacterium]